LQLLPPLEFDRQVVLPGVEVHIEGGYVASAQPVTRLHWTPAT